jgi:hypothetical protein
MRFQVQIEQKLTKGGEQEKKEEEEKKSENKINKKSASRPHRADCAR